MKKKILAVLISLASFGAYAAEVNVYSSRHYASDDQLYNAFTQATGIKVNRIEAKDEELVERLKAEGSRSPADVLILADAARLQDAQDRGLLAPVDSAVLTRSIPTQFREPNNHWFGFSSRARVIAYDSAQVSEAQAKSYATLAEPSMKGKVCVRSGSHPYNLSLLSAMMVHEGEAKAEAWAKGVVANLARKPKGGDTDQIRAIAAGDCAIGLTNSYYYLRLQRSDKPEDEKVIDRVKMAFPDMAGQGTHVNISGGGMLANAPHKVEAVKLLEFFATDEAQQYFANGNNEFAVVAGVKLDNPELNSVSNFKADTLNAAAIGAKRNAAAQIMDRAGWK
ncbi:MAG: extracellular solute-binding protein [Gammaproteobacteria bacterium]|nr:extracellular solute-binding protein [Gammaproteobacteria bacterium]